MLSKDHPGKRQGDRYPARQRTSQSPGRHRVILPQPQLNLDDLGADLIPPSLSALHHWPSNKKWSRSRQSLAEQSRKPVQQERIESFKEEQTNNILNGTYMPIVVDRKGYIVNGHHRYDAFKELGINQVKVIIVDESIDTLVDNFADGKKPGRKGISKRVGIPKGATMAQLQKYAKSKCEKGRMARWQLNMRRGRKKKK